MFDLRKSVELSGLRISAVVCLFVVTMIAAFNLSGCGGSSSSSNGSSSSPSVTVTATQTTVDGSGGASGSGTAQTSTLSATVSNDKSTNGTPDGVTWSVSGAPSSSLSNTSTTGATFTAPAATSVAQTVTITATSVADTSKNGTATITVPALLSIPTAEQSLSAAVGTAYSQQLTVSGGNGTDTWTPTPVSGSLPAGWTLTSGGLLSGPAPTHGQAGTYTFTLAVKDSGTYSATTPQLTVTINPATAIAFVAAPTATGTYKVAYSSAVSATGGAGALTYSSTNLPSWLTLNSSNGAITGTPAAVGTYNFTVTASDGYGDTTTSPQYTIVVSYPAMNITTGGPLPTGYIGSSYPSITLVATGGTGVSTNYSWVVTGSNTLPAGLNLSSGGVISGTPTGSPSGPTSITFKVTDTVAGISTTASLSITVGAGVSISPAAGALPTAYANSAYSSGNLTASGGSGTGYTWSVVSGSAPPTWLSLSSTSGSTTTLTGTPATTASAVSFSLKVTDSVGNSATIAYNVTVGAGVSISPVTGTTLAPAYVSSLYTSVPLTASGGNGTYTWSVVSGSAPPSWLSLSATSGSSINLTGTPTVAASPASFSLKVTDTAGNSATVSYSITVNAGIGISPVTGTSLTAYTGTAYTSPTLTATGGSGTGYTWAPVSGSAPPSWLSLSSTSGSTTTLTGTPTTVATAVSFSLKVTDSGGLSQTVTYSITVNAGISISPASGTTLPEAYAGSLYNSGTITVTGGNGNYSWGLTNTPSWLGQSPMAGATGSLTGTPSAAAGPATFSLKVSDNAGNSQTVTYYVTVGAGVSISTPTIPTFYPGAAYPTTTFTASGGTGTGYTWSWATTGGTALPSGLSINPTTGAITGTPANATSSSVTSNLIVTAKDSGGNTITTNVSITIEATLAISTASPLPTGSVGSSYPSTTLGASGGTGVGYNWTVPSSTDQTCLNNRGLSLTSAGVLTSGGSTLVTGNVGTCTSFGVQVNDNASPNHTASKSFSVSVSNFAITTPSPLPTAYTGTAYSQPLTVVGGSVSDTYQWSVSINSTGFAALGLSINSSNGTISGTAAGLVTGSATFTVSVTDTTISATATQPYTINVYNPLSLTAPSSTVPGPAILNTAYTGNTIYATGGSGNYSWSVTGLGSGMSYNNPTGSSLVINGTAPSTSQNMNFFVTLTDTSTGKTYGPITYVISVGPATPLTIPAANPTSLPSATVSTTYSGAINASGGSGSGYVWSINGSAVPISGTAFPLSDGLSASNTGGNTLSITGALGSSAQTITLTNVTVTDSAGDNAGPITYTITVNPIIPTGYTVSGTVNYTGSNAGWVYLELIPNSGCSGCNQNLGTAIDGTAGGPFASPKAYTIHGVPAGTYTLKAYMDGIGFGIENASDPTASLSNLNVTSAGLSNQNFTLADPSAVSLGTLTPSWDPGQGYGVFSGGAVVSFDPICNGSGCNNGGIEMPTSYFLQYSTDSTFNSGVTRKCFLAQGGNSPWIVSGLITGQTYYFRAAGYATACTNTPGTLTYSAAEPTNGLLIGAPTAGSALSGTVTFTPPAGVTLAGGPLYVGCYASGTLYAERIATPVSPQAYSVMVPNGTSCMVFGFLDQFNSGLIGGPGELSNTNNGIGMVSVTVNGATPNQNFTLPSGNSVVEIQTDVSTNSNGTGYGVGFHVYGEYKLPVAVELLSETPNVNGTVVDVVLPVDIATDAFNNYNNEFDYWPQATGTPVVGDTYTFKVTYFDGTSENLNAAVTGVLTNAVATNLSPAGTGVSVTPNFSWVYPSNASGYLYQFQLNVNNGNTVWQIPQKHSNSNGFASTMTPFITWDVDPTNSGDLPSSSYLSNGGLQAGTNYNWSITAYDANMNQAQVQASFTTTAANLSLSVNNKGFGPALAGYPFSGSISASGGSGAYTTWTVNGTSITATSLGSALTFSGNDGLEAYISGSALYVVGTPTTAELSLPLNVTVTDSLSNTVSQNFPLVVSAPPTGGASNSNNARLKGTYVCKSDGFDDGTGSRWTTLSTVIADGYGNFTTGGAYDTNTRDLSAPISGGYTGTYNIGADNNGITNMVATVPSLPNANSAWAIALTGSGTVAQEFRKVRIDDVGTTPTGIHGSGVCYLATTSAFAASTVSGSFVFSNNGESGGGIPSAGLGLFNASNGNVNSGYFDGYTLSDSSEQTLTFNGGSITTPNATTGRSTLTLNSSGGTGTFLVYVIDANRMFIQMTGVAKAQSGDMRKQQQSDDTAATLLSGSSVLYSQAYNGNSSGSVTGYNSMLLQLSAAPSSTYVSVATINQFYNDDNGCFDDGGGENTSNCNKNKEVGTTTTITLDTSNPGRATFSPGGGGESAFLYFFKAGSALYLDLSGTNHDLQTGWLEAQTQPSSPPFANANIAGSFLEGQLPRMNSGDNDNIMEGTLNGSGGSTGSNTLANAGSLQWDQSYSAMGTMGYSWLSTAYGAFSVTANGTALESCIDITPVQSGATGKAVCMENTSQGANVDIMEQ